MYKIREREMKMKTMTSASPRFSILKISRDLSLERKLHFPQKNVALLLLLSDDAFFAPRVDVVVVVVVFARLVVVSFVSESSAFLVEVASSTSF